MPSEKIRYSRQRMADKPRTDIELTPLKAEIEAVFSKHNIDEDCDYFDGMYSPDYVCQNMMKAVIDVIKSGDFPDKELQRLKKGLEKLMQTEAYEDYGAPFVLDAWKKFLKA